MVWIIVNWAATAVLVLLVTAGLWSAFRYTIQAPEAAHTTPKEIAALAIGIGVGVVIGCLFFNSLRLTFG